MVKKLHLQRQKLIAYFTILTPFLATVAGLVWTTRTDSVYLFDILILIGGYLITMFGVTAGYHRLFTHRSYEASRPLKMALAIAGATAFQGPLIFWVASHRCHHQYSDAEGDPHSPHIHGDGTLGAIFRGMFHSHLGWLLSNENRIQKSKVRDVITDPELMWVDKFYFLWVLGGILFPGILGLLYHQSITGFCSCLVIGGFVRVFLVQHAIWSVNSFGHVLGYRSFEAPDESRNNLILGWLA